MVKEDFVTTTDQEERVARDRYLSPEGRYYPNPSNMILVVDPAFVPGTMVETLITPDSDGKCVAMLTNHPFEWSPWDESNVEIELKFELWGDVVFCTLCSAQFELGELGFRRRGSPVCRACVPQQLLELQRVGYEYADRVVVRSSANSTKDRYSALDEYIETLKGTASS